MGVRSLGSYGRYRVYRVKPPALTFRFSVFVLFVSVFGLMGVDICTEVTYVHVNIPREVHTMNM